jgi:hypothetical protein
MIMFELAVARDKSVTEQQSNALNDLTLSRKVFPIQAENPLAIFRSTDYVHLGAYY